MHLGNVTRKYFFYLSPRTVMHTRRWALAKGQRKGMSKRLTLTWPNDSTPTTTKTLAGSARPSSIQSKTHTRFQFLRTQRSTQKCLPLLLGPQKHVQEEERGCSVPQEKNKGKTLRVLVFRERKRMTVEKEKEKKRRQGKKGGGGKDRRDETGGEGKKKGK